jgi:hypothetical protein
MAFWHRFDAAATLLDPVSIRGIIAGTGSQNEKIETL